jgi:pescadillo
MITLFATLPANDKISTHHVAECTRLIAEFQTYIIKSGSLRKSFLSIKGIYYQTVIHGQTITWIAPYRFAQTVPTDVDFRVMATFLEIYETLLAFVNFKLFSDMGLSYPPTATDSDVEVKEVEMDMDSVPKPVVAPTTDTETVPQLSAPTRVFAGFKFALSREVPQEALTFVIQSMGGKIVSETQATHVVSDRPGAAVEGCEVIQPQWVFDCLNANKVVKTDGYHPGETLPPHLSPFVSAGEDDYVPAGAEVEAETVETEAAEEKEKMSEADKELAKIMMSKRDLKLYNKVYAINVDAARQAAKG